MERSDEENESTYEAFFDVVLRPQPQAFHARDLSQSGRAWLKASGKLWLGSHHLPYERNLILPTTTTKITTDEICRKSWVVIVTSHYRSYISRINGKYHRAFGPSDALAVTSRQNVSHRCFLTETLSASASRPPVDVSGPEEVPYA